MKKLVFMAVILSAFALKSMAFEDSYAGYWDPPFFKQKTYSNIWKHEMTYLIAAHGNTHYKGHKMFSFVRVIVYSSPYDRIHEGYVYSAKDEWEETGATVDAPSGLYVYKVVLQMSAEVLWSENPIGKYTACIDANIGW